LTNAPGIVLHAGNILDFSFPSGHFSHVLHAATTSAQETSAGEPPLAKFDMLVGGTRRVLEFAKACGALNLLFTSSGVASEQAPDGGLIRENHSGAPATTDPATALGQGKRAAEFLCACYGEQYGWNTSIARCFSFVGPYMPLDLQYAIGNFIRAALSNRPIVVKGDGTPVRSYLYTGDLVVWLLTLLVREGRPRIYNVGSDQGISIGNLAALVRDELNPALEVHILGQAGLSVGNPLRNYYVPNIDRARAELALDVWTNPSNALRLTAAHESARELQSSNR
jgi:dTDP-glucose 4,6-dehydratase/UDP-glucose 4-epimerase